MFALHPAAVSSSLSQFLLQTLVIILCFSSFFFDTLVGFICCGNQMLKSNKPKDL